MVGLLFSERELTLIYFEHDHAAENYARRKAWIRISDLAVAGVDEKKAMAHLLWFQSIHRVVIEDVDPSSGALLIRLNFDDFLIKKPKMASLNDSLIGLIAAHNY